MTAIVIFAHGSSVESANDAVRTVSKTVAATGGFDLWETAFLEMGKPDLPAAVECLIARGAEKIVVLPYFLMFKQAGMLDTRTALVLVNLSIVLPYAVWMVKGFIDAVPLEIEESAMVDGAPRSRVIWEIVVPAALPGIITAAVFSFTLTWNEFLFALILSKQDALTLPLGLVGFRTERGDLWELMASGGLLITAPMFLISLLVQKQFVGSLTAGSVR